MRRIGFSFLDRPGLGEQIALAPVLEELGYESVWAVETRLARDAVTTMSAILSVTTRLRVGGMINTWTRGAALLAMTFATLGELAPGRIGLTLHDYWDPMAARQGIRREDPAGQMTEYIDAMRRLLRLEAPITTTGRHVQLDKLQLDLGHGMPRTPIECPIYVLGTNPDMVAIAGRCADGVFVPGITSRSYAEAAVQTYRDSSAGGTGRDDQCPKFLNIAMSADREEARDAARRLLALYIGEQPHIGVSSGLDADRLSALRATLAAGPTSAAAVSAAAAYLDDAVVDSLVVAGTPAECRERIGEWLDLGISYPIYIPITANTREIAEELAPARF